MVQHLLGGGDAGVGADEQLLQLQPELLIEGRAVEEVSDVAEPGAAGALKRFGRELSRTDLFALLPGLRGAAKEAYQGQYPLVVLAGHRTSAPEGGQGSEPVLATDGEDGLTDGCPSVCSFYIR
jgi:hypothetical protein